MSRKWKSVCLSYMLLGCSLLLRGQIEPITNLTVEPLPIPGGDKLPGFGLVHQFFPGPPNQTPPFDPIGSDPHGITNFRGTTAMGYTLGRATDNKGRAYAVITDVRVYQGEYVGAESPNPNSAGYTNSAPARGTFVEI